MQKPTSKQSQTAKSRIPRWLVIVLLATFGVFLIAYLSIGWYFSGKLFELKPQVVEYDQTVQLVDSQNYVIKGSAYDIDGIVGGIRTDGSMIGIFDRPTDTNKSQETSRRQLDQASAPAPKAGDKISLQGNIWITDPKQALGLEYQNVKYLSPAGVMNAWVVPGDNPKLWTIGVHGIGANKNELLRFIQPVHDTGSTMMIINYRGDVGNPPAPDGRNHFGDTEWQDVEAAVRYAKSQGATEIQLYGVSLGGSLTQNYLRRSKDVPNTNITKVVLDSPALDWNEILRHRVEKMGYPAFIAKPGMDMARLRAGINFNRISTKPGSIKYPTLIIHNNDDTSVPQAASKRVAEAQPELIEFVDFGSGGHIRAWNHDPERYEQTVSNFLDN